VCKFVKFIQFQSLFSVDTVKTRLQGQKPTKPSKYQNMLHAYITIFKQEGVAHGLYGGIAPAMLGSGIF
jgi:hypothetical protein